ncbi:unnamed protein product [Rhizoctonia solani]|uniref:Uncharacterized protein n=1 Tax=Rhizoctonia solani TaxID=456999 RepID=A0A8H3B1U5_9AGAM|nr:unnamed protein product [Rhizoctonia solani]
MNVPSLPKRSLKLHTGSDPDHMPLPTIIARRLEIIVPAHGLHEARLSTQVARYAITSGVRLADVLSSYTAEETRAKTSMSMSARDEEGAWLIDGQLGLLVMKISKERYRTLGIAGKETNGAYVIQVDLKDKTTKLYSRAKDAVEAWCKTWEVWTTGDIDLSDSPTIKFPSRADEAVTPVIQVDLKDKTTKLYSRAKDAVEAWGKTWEVWTTGDIDLSDSPTIKSPHTIKKFEPETVLLKDVLVPKGLPLDQDEDESWVELFEIASADQINPYISSYSAPEGSKAGSVTRFRWEGPLSDKFVRDTIQVARQGDQTGLVAFSISAFDYVPLHLLGSRCETCAGVFCSGAWALAENISPA